MYPSHLREEREELLREGFSSWKRRDYFRFVAAVKQHGRFDMDGLVEAMPGKTQEEVEAYAKAFWRLGPSRLPKWEGIVAAVAKAENKAREIQKLRRALATNLVRCDEHGEGAWQSETVALGHPRRPSSFSRTTNRFLLCQNFALGHGRWEDLARNVRQSDTLCFDYYARTRTPYELQRRTETLMR